jgi:hypothetical protein
MVEARCKPDFPEEPLRTECGRDFRLQDLERNQSVVSHIVREVHGGHAASAQLTLDAVAVSQSGGETLLGWRQTQSLLTVSTRYGSG